MLKTNQFRKQKPYAVPSKRLVPSPSLYMSLFIITKTIELMARYEAPADTKAGTIGKYIWVLLGLMGHGQEFGE